MQNIEKIHAMAYTLLIERSRCFIDNEDAENVARAPIDCMSIVAHFVGDDKGVTDELESLFPECTFQAGALIFQQIIDGNEFTEALKSAAQGYSAMSNPLRFAARETVKELDDSPEFIRIRPIVRKEGLPIVLGAIDEMMNRGVHEEAIVSALIDAYMYDSGFIDEERHITSDHSNEAISEAWDSFEELARNNWEFGAVDGSIDTAQAKVGKAVGGVGGAVAGAKVGAVVGSIIPGAGTLIGAAVGGAVGNFFGKTFGEELARPDEK